MLKEAIEKIVSLADSKTYQINGETYSDRPLHHIPEYTYSPERVDVYSLDSVVSMIHAEMDKNLVPLFVNIKSYNSVEVFTTFNNTNCHRDVLYSAKSSAPEPRLGWNDYESAMIALRSQYVQDDEIAYVLQLLSRITDENSVSSADNGVTQTVEARAGISLAQKMTVRPRVTLCPYRTFLEVEQPASEFLLRLREGGQIGLFEADGGMWKLAAKRNIQGYLQAHIHQELLESGKVIILG